MNNEIKSKRKTPLIQKINTIFALYLVISNLMPQIRIIPGYYILMFLSIFLWLFVAFIAHPSFFTRLSANNFLIYIYIIYTVVVPFIFGNGTIGKRYLEHSVMLIFYLIYKYNYIYKYTNSSKLIIKLSLLSMTITSILTLVGLFNNPYLARSIKSSGEDTIILRAQGIGGYEFIYSLVFVSILLFYILYNRNVFRFSKRLNVVNILLFILFVSTIIYANYFTAFIMLIISISIILIVGIKRILIKVWVLLMAIILMFFRKSVLEYMIKIMINFLKTGATVEKLLILQATIQGNSGNNSLFSARASALSLSWDSFLGNPIGGLVFGNIKTNGGFLTGFGQHSHFVDTFALYGLVIGILNIYIILHPFFIRFNKDQELFSLNLSILTSVLIIFSFNTVTPSIGFVIFFIYPVFYDWIMELKGDIKI